jgi:hypothetical protein
MVVADRIGGVHMENRARRLRKNTQAVHWAPSAFSMLFNKDTVMTYDS